MPLISPLMPVPQPVCVFLKLLITVMSQQLYLMHVFVLCCMLLLLMLQLQRNTFSETHGQYYYVVLF